MGSGNGQFSFPNGFTDVKTNAINATHIEARDRKPDQQAINADGPLKLRIGGAYNVMLGDYLQAYRYSVGFYLADPNSLNASYPGLKFNTSNP
ncbi:hypothetical protein [Desulfitobacterium metallireducens]|uniref:Uncharacterized protein n=1 Tax=Desulfitobacterium metallireducens DSM 15288 TaxID=871968 RepID=W0ECU6_9FIRM|nr:hypothetical protein [Desulfitobacterium metallireducens]AHF08592.1 hypothetical protein DESME_09135 [Desulfitobacterium metallireducens DSM 15288]